MKLNEYVLKAGTKIWIVPEGWVSNNIAAEWATFFDGPDWTSWTHYKRRLTESVTVDLEPWAHTPPNNTKDGYYFARVNYPGYFGILIYERDI